MKRFASVLTATILIASIARALPAAEFDTEGVNPGKWTMDLDAARKHAKEKKSAILLNFTGSDWCGWCKLMEENVFSADEWKEYAKGSVVMVMLDFPRDKSLVPEKYVKRNEKLKETYNVRGYPTYVLLDDDGETVLGRLRAGRKKTARSFVAEVKGLTRYRASEVARYTETLKDDEKAEYQKIIGGIDDCKKKLKETKKQIAEAEKKVEELEKKVEKLKETATEFRAGKLGPERLKEYKETRAGLEKARQDLAAWVATGPSRTPENDRKYDEMNAEIAKLEAKLAEF